MYPTTLNLIYMDQWMKYKKPVSKPSTHGKYYYYIWIRFEYYCNIIASTLTEKTCKIKKLAYNLVSIRVEQSEIQAIMYRNVHCFPKDNQKQIELLYKKSNIFIWYLN